MGRTPWKICKIIERHAAVSPAFAVQTVLFMGFCDGVMAEIVLEYGKCNRYGEVERVRPQRK